MSQGATPKTWNVNQLRVQAFGVPVTKGPGLTGAGENVFVEISQDGPCFAYKKGADGSVTRYATNEPITKIKIHFMQTSAGNGIMSAMLAKDVASLNGDGIGTFTADDMNGASLFTAGSCWVAGPPEVGYGKDPTERVWELHATDTDRFDGGN